MPYNLQESREAARKFQAYLNATPGFGKTQAFAQTINDTQDTFDGQDRLRDDFNLVDQALSVDPGNERLNNAKTDLRSIWEQKIMRAHLYLGEESAHFLPSRTNLKSVKLWHKVADHLNTYSLQETHSEVREWREDTLDVRRADALAQVERALHELDGQQQRGQANTGAQQTSPTPAGELLDRYNASFAAAHQAINAYEHTHVSDHQPRGPRPA